MKTAIWKKVIKIILLKIIPILALLGFVSVPFMSGWIESKIACFIWIPCAIVFVLDSVRQWVTTKQKDDPPKAVDILSRGFSIEMLAIMGSAFVINYFDTKYSWYWAAAVIFALAMTFSVFNIFAYVRCLNPQKSTVNKSGQGLAVKYVLFYLLVDAFYISIFTKTEWGQFAFGGIALLILLYSVASSFLSQSIKQKWLLIHDFVIAIAMTVYLVYIIPDEALQNVVLVLVSAIYGGFIALVGVAWTIKDGKRQEAESRRLEKIPYLQAEFGEWMSREERKTEFPDMWLTITRSQEDDTSTYAGSLTITNIGLGMATEIKCKWKTDELTSDISLPISILKCEESYKLSILGTAKLPDNKSYNASGVLVFEYSDLLGNLYNQELAISFEINRTFSKMVLYKLDAPKHIIN